jgi:hypothetical protein
VTVVCSQLNSSLGGAPFVYTLSTFPGVVTPKNPARGAAVFIQKGLTEDYREAFSFLSPGFARFLNLQAPGFRASFGKAGGWWDLLSDAPFFFAAGYAVHPPGPPYMRAISELQPDSAAPFTFTQSTLIPIFPGNVTVTDFAFPPQHVADTAPWTWTGTAKPITTAGSFRPFGYGIFTRQLEADTAAFTHVRSPFTPAANTQISRPPIAGQAFGLQQLAEGAPLAYSRFVMPVPGKIPPFGAQILTRALEADTAPFVWVAYRVITTIQLPRPGVFAKLHDDPVAPFAFFRDHPPVPFIPSTLSVTDFAFALQQPGDTAPYVFTQFTPPVPLLVLPSGTAVLPMQTYDPRDLAATFNFCWPGLLWETVPSLVGLLLQQAIYNVVNAGLEPTVLYAPSTTVKPDIVLSQSPPSGTLLPVNSVVTITASSGPASPAYGQVVVPTVIGLFAKDADQAIFNAGLSLGPYMWVASGSPGGTVVNQSLVGGSLATLGTVIILTLSQGPQYPSYSTTVTTSVP